MTADTVLLSYVTLTGLCIGSFLNVVIYRLPLGQSLVSPGSRCPKCGYVLRWYDNVPVVSWAVPASSSPTTCPSLPQKSISVPTSPCSAVCVLQ